MAAASPRVSILDLAPVGEGQDPGDSLRASIELARIAERLGYSRHWVAEHHNLPGIASSAPAVLIAHLAAATRRLRVGSGGVMLPNHAPLVVAEQFGTLEAIHPGRIDLGIGRAPGTDARTAAALRRTPEGLGAEDFPRELADLLGFFASEDPEEGGRPDGIAAVPGAGKLPEVWLLGSSGYSAQLAAALGMPFCFAHHFAARNTLPALELYRRGFQPSDRLERPWAMLAVAVIAAEDDERARYLAGPSRLAMARLRAGRPGRLPTPEQAAAHELSAAEPHAVSSLGGGSVVGGPETVGAGLDELLEGTAADELMITTMVHDPADRIRTLEIVAELRGLAGTEAEAGPAVAAGPAA